MPRNMKSVMTFSPSDTETERANKFINWLRNNKSSVADRNIPNAVETRKMLHE